MTFPVIEVDHGNGPPLRVVIDRRVEIGRACAGVLVDDPSASRRHLAVWPDGDRCLAEDLGSRNGTRRNGQPIDGPAVLGVGDELHLGQVVVRRTGLFASPNFDAAHSGGRDARQTIVRPVGISERPHTSISSLAAAVAEDRSSHQRLDDLGARFGSTITLLFSDIEASTTTAQRLGDRRWFEVLQAHDRIARSVVAENHGTVVKSLGDGLMCTFPTTQGALRAAAAFQPALDDDAVPVRVRVGLHTGEAIAAGDDLFGLHVNVAARVADLAAGGQILVSSVTRAIAATSGHATFGPEQHVELKGITGTWGVSPVLGGSADE